MTLPQPTNITTNPILLQLLNTYWQKLDLLKLDSQHVNALAQKPERLNQLAKLFLCSDFARNVLIHSAESSKTMLADGNHLDHRLTPTDFNELEQQISQTTDIHLVKKQLRQFRNKAMLGIIWRDINHVTSLKQTIEDLSLLADQLIDITLAWLLQKAIQLYGKPIGAISQTQQNLMIIAMGKYGANELNLSSDIDLIFVYGEEGETDGEKPISNQMFFARLGQQLINCLDERTEDGFVFRVDMRLRPFGQSGALAINLNAFEQYYQEQGRDWERYALIKARIVNKERTINCQRLEEIINKFTYRRYIDFGAIEALREMKALINREAMRQSLAKNIKTGIGGIREIEFIAQVFQLIYGGRERRLQHPSLYHAFAILDELHYLPTNAVAELLKAYEFLRNLEHRLQAIHDQQTQTLPPDELTKERIAFAMDFANWEQLTESLTKIRHTVHTHFQRLIEQKDSEKASKETDMKIWQTIWFDQMDQQKLTQQISTLGWTQTEAFIEALQTFREHHAVKNLQSVAKHRLDQFMPQLLRELSTTKQPLITFKRMLPLIEAILRRSAYILLLLENPKALKKYVQFSVISPWFSDYLAKHPNLLDELISLEGFFHIPSRLELEKSLQQQLLCIPEDDLEQQMELLRHFKQSQVIRVAIGEITEQIPLMKASDYLTWTAEAILNHTLNLAWHQLTQKYGRPSTSSQLIDDLNFIIIGYGKLGGIELGFDSDLDLVFIYDTPENSSTTGPKIIDSQQFFIKLGQRIIHLLNTQTHSGVLYEVDMRLRPSGKSGLLVSTLTGFKDYQQKEAWTWEHQALVRARVIAGSQNLHKKFSTIRKQVLSKQRDQAALKQDIINMRVKMHESLTHTTEISAETLLKHERGGIVDIEFIVQYAVLRWSHKFPELTQYTDNIRILESLAKTGCLSQTMATDLIETYRFYRLELHRLTLGLHSETSIMDSLSEKKSLIEDCWNRLFS